MESGEGSHLIVALGPNSIYLVSEASSAETSPTPQKSKNKFCKKEWFHTGKNTKSCFISTIGQCNDFYDWMTMAWRRRMLGVDKIRQ